MYCKKFKLNSLEATKYIAINLYKHSKCGDLFALYGDIGVGKSTFVRYFINTAARQSYIPSPSFNIYFKYQSPKGPIYHMDAWRIENEEEVINLGVLDSLKESIFLVEWAENIETFLPTNKLKIKINYYNSFRTLTLSGDKSWGKRLDKTFSRVKIEK